MKKPCLRDELKQGGILSALSHRWEVCCPINKIIVFWMTVVNWKGWLVIVIIVFPTVFSPIRDIIAKTIFNPIRIHKNHFLSIVIITQEKWLCNGFLEGFETIMSLGFNGFHEGFHIVPIDVFLGVIGWVCWGFKGKFDGGRWDKCSC